MKSLRFFVSLFVLVCLTLVAVIAGAEVTAVTDATGAVLPAIAVTPAPTVSFLVWLKANIAVILGIGLTLSELMGASPWFQGNGIIDSISKSLKFLLQKQTL
jgi:hypothetical protein